MADRALLPEPGQPTSCSIPEPVSKPTPVCNMLAVPSLFYDGYGDAYEALYREVAAMPMARKDEIAAFLQSIGNPGQPTINTKIRQQIAFLEYMGVTPAVKVPWLWLGIAAAVAVAGGIGLFYKVKRSNTPPMAGSSRWRPMGTWPLRAISKERWHATAAQRRMYGGRTVTAFWIEGGPEPISVTGYGKTPGERKTDALIRAEQYFIGKGFKAPSQGNLRLE